MDFDYDGRRGGGGTVTSSLNGKKVACGKIAKTEPNVYSADETASVSIDNQVGPPCRLNETPFPGRPRERRSHPCAQPAVSNTVSEARGVLGDSGASGDAGE